MPRNRAVLLMSFILLLFGACQRFDFTSEKKGTPIPARSNSQSDAKIEKKEDTIKNLICFKCHIYERFTGAPQKGIFPHIIHAQFEYHCNQCHSFRGHKTMVINRDICMHCHGEMPKLKGILTRSPIPHP